MTGMPDLPTPDALRRRLAELREGRGYLLAHHGALAAATPDLHDAYLRMYCALTLTRRHLDPFEKEFVWLAVLTAEREAIGTHHLELFDRAGGTLEQARVAFHLAGYAAAADAFAFVEARWGTYYGALDTAAAYLDGVAALRGAIPEALGHLALLAVQAVRKSEWGVAAHLRAAYAAGVPEHKMVEALSLIIWPAGVNRFYEACVVWHDLMTAGIVAPSPLYRAWAETPAHSYRRGTPGLDA